MANKTQDVGDIHFPFPFTPYSIQKDFMAELYQVLESGKIGIFESPTGTVSMNTQGLRGLSGDPGYNQSQAAMLIYLCWDFYGLKLGKTVLSINLSE